MNQFMKLMLLYLQYTQKYISQYEHRQCNVYYLSEVNDNFDNLVDFQTLREIKKKTSNK